MLLPYHCVDFILHSKKVIQRQYQNSSLTLHLNTFQGKKNRVADKIQGLSIISLPSFKISIRSLRQSKLETTIGNVFRQATDVTTECGAFRNTEYSAYI